MSRDRYKNSRGLTDRMYRVVAEYFSNGFDKQAAMLEAGYSAFTADKRAAQVFDHPAVKKEITRRHQRMDKTAELSREWITERFMELADAGRRLAKYKVVEEDGSLGWDFTGAPDEDLALVKTIESSFYTDGVGRTERAIKKFKVDPGDPIVALTALARIQGMFQDRLKLEGDDGVVERLQAARARVAKKPDAPDK